LNSVKKMNLKYAFDDSFWIDWGHQNNTS